MRIGLLGAICAGALTLAACGGDDAGDTTTTAAAATTAAGASGGAAGSGDCDADLAGIRAYVDAGTPKLDLDPGAAADLGLLLGAASVDCAPQVFADFSAEPDVFAYLTTG